MSPDLLNSLLSRKKKVLAEKQELDDELNELNTLIRRYQSGSSKGESKSRTQIKTIIKIRQPRVRGVLAAARKAIEQLSGPFDKGQLLDKIRENKEFAHKEITASNIRNTLRLLAQDGVIEIECEATARSCAKYISASSRQEQNQVRATFGDDSKRFEQIEGSVPSALKP